MDHLGAHVSNTTASSDLERVACNNSNLVPSSIMFVASRLFEVPLPAARQCDIIIILYNIKQHHNQEISFPQKESTFMSIQRDQQGRPSSLLSGPGCSPRGSTHRVHRTDAAAVPRPRRMKWL